MGKLYFGNKNNLIGEHYLSGVDITTEEIEQYKNYYEDCEVIRFVIDNKTYKAIEDPDDGYRSYLKEFKITNEKVTNCFPPQKVIGKIKNDDNDEQHDIIQFIDAATEKVVLEVGTGNTNDYYPYCVFYWAPEYLAINVKK